jgi:hypothetical protein
MFSSVPLATFDTLRYIQCLFLRNSYIEAPIGLLQIKLSTKANVKAKRSQTSQT